MRSLSVNEMKSVSGGTSILSKYALPPGTPISDEMARQGFFDPTNTGNAYIDMVNTFALVGTGELSESVLTKYIGSPCEEEQEAFYAMQNSPASSPWFDFLLNLSRHDQSTFEEGARAILDGYSAAVTDSYIQCMEGELGIAP